MVEKEKFQYMDKGIARLTMAIKRKIFQSITRGASNFFLRIKDTISVGPAVDGVYDPIVTELIRYYNKIGYRDFFIDIGANIGFTTCQNGDDFRYTMCFEPNPLCVHLLRVHTALMLSKTNIQINEYGLGASSADLDLWIPLHNWGGAFVRGKDNSYSDEILASKDGFKVLAPENYRIVKISIKECKEILKEKFSILLKDGCVSGVIKIDVEGMEMVIINGIADSIPANVKVKLIFENWDPELNIANIKNFFSDRKIAIHRVETSSFYKKFDSMFFKFLLLPFCRIRTNIVPIEQAQSSVGEIIICIE